MIDRKDIEKLASLSRIKLTEAEKDSFQKEIEGILGYVAQIQKVSSDTESAVKKPDSMRPNNMLREDIQTVQGGQYTEALLEAAPFRNKNYVKVKNIF